MYRPRLLFPLPLLQSWSSLGKKPPLNFPLSPPHHPFMYEIAISRNHVTSLLLQDLITCSKHFYSKVTEEEISLMWLVPSNPFLLHKQIEGGPDQNGGGLTRDEGGGVREGCKATEMSMGCGVRREELQLHDVMHLLHCTHGENCLIPLPTTPPEHDPLSPLVVVVAQVTSSSSS